MKLVYGKTKQDVFMLLTLGEEEALAQWTMDLLSENWFDGNSGDFYKLVRRLYWAKCAGGRDLNFRVYERLLDMVETSNRTTQLCIDRHIEGDENEAPVEIKKKWFIPESALIFKRKNDGKARDLPLMDATGNPYPKRRQIQIYQNETRSIWREVWDQHKALKSSYEAFLVFPGDDPGEGHRLAQEAKERRFWAEVERRKVECEISRKEAERFVADYMPRGDLSSEERSEFEPPKTLVEFMEFELQESDDAKDDFDYYFPEGNPESDLEND